MNWRHYSLLFIIAAAVLFGIGSIQTVPGYMDAEYYYLGGIQLAGGEGFVEPILWNYLDDPTGLPHPSHAYWMPLASLVAAFGMWFTGNLGFWSARLGFFFLAVLIPLVTAALGYQFSGNSRWAFVSGLLAVFSGLYLPYISTTDTFTLYMLLGGILLLLLPKTNFPSPFAMVAAGIIVGLLHLSRADGIIWLPSLILVMIYGTKSRAFLKIILKNLFLLLLGYILVMSPWIYRNLAEFGSFLSPGGLRTLWLTNYDQLFSYPAGQLTFQHWWSSGLVEILKARLWALGINTQRTIAEQGMVFLTPLVILGMWRSRSDLRVQIGFWAWMLTFSVMTLFFPFAGARGGLFHSCAALQPLFWAITPLGLNVFVEWGERQRGWKPEQAHLVFSSALVGFAVFLSVGLFFQRVIGPDLTTYAWEKTSSHYQAVESELQTLGATPDDIVMVKNPPGYNVVSHRSAIVIPDGDVRTLISAATRYGARYIVLELDHSSRLDDLYQDPQNSHPYLTYLLTLNNTRIFEAK
jgi:hypothetical protein